ncbi:MAG: DUF4397 domain-containing protein, partial [Burkholderiales bacterium]
RLAHVAPGAPNVTLQRNGGARSEATNVSYPTITDYFNVDNSSATWSVQATASGATVGSTTSFESKRGHKYTILAVADSAASNSIATIDDPTNRSLISDDSLFRAFNASFNAQNIDVYLIGLNESVNNTTPALQGIAFKNAKPDSGSDGRRSRGGDYQVVVTTAGTKTVLAKGKVTVPDNRDVLFVTVPNDVNSPTGINLLVKFQGQPGASLVPAI